MTPTRVAMSQIQAVTHRKVRADSSPESTTGDCLTCSDTEEAAIHSCHKKFWKKVQASHSISKGCLWSEAQLKWNGDSHHAVWESNYEVIKTEQELSLKEDHHSFEVNKMTDRADQLFHIKEATHSKIHTWESETGVQGMKKIIVQLLKQFHACFYQLYEKGMANAMVGLQGLHWGNAFRCPNVSASMGLKSFYPWCLKLGRNTKSIALHLKEVHNRMAIMCHTQGICQHVCTEHL